MGCTCPSSVFGDYDLLPRPALYSVQNLGACFDDTGAWLYGVVRKSSGGTVYKILRWPYPALNTYEEIVTSTTETIYPCVVGSDLYFIDTDELYVAPAAGGSASLFATFSHATPSYGFWGLRYVDGLLWAAYYDVTGAGPAFISDSGFLSVDTGTATVTRYGFSTAALDDGPHLSSFLDVAVTDDHALWSSGYDGIAGFDMVIRFDTTSHTFANTGTPYSFGVPAPTGEGGKVRVRDLAPVVDLSMLVDPSMTVTTDACLPAAIPDLFVEGMVAHTPGHDLIVFANRNDRLMEVTCTAGGWHRRVSFG